MNEMLDMLKLKRNDLFVFSFEGIDAYYYWINGAAVLTVVSLHKPEVAV